MLFVTLMSMKVFLAMAMARSLRWAFQNAKDQGVLDRIEPVSGHTFIDDLKMASAITIAAAIMIPAILVYASMSWLIRCSRRWPGRVKALVGM